MTLRLVLTEENNCIWVLVNDDRRRFYYIHNMHYYTFDDDVLGNPADYPRCINSSWLEVLHKNFDSFIIKEFKLKEINKEIILEKILENFGELFI